MKLRTDATIRRQEPGKAPGPSAELDFWSRQAAALGSLDEQLRSERLQQALQQLEAAHSTLLPGFVRCRPASCPKPCCRTPIGSRVEQERPEICWVRCSCHRSAEHSSRSQTQFTQGQLSTQSFGQVPVLGCSLCRDVEKGRAEAADNVAYLKPLRKHVQRLEARSKAR